MVTYGQIYHQNEVEQSRYNFDESDAAMAPVSTSTSLRPNAFASPDRDCFGPRMTIV